MNKQITTIAAICLGVIIGHVQAAPQGMIQETTQGAEDWYMNHYAPIWKENSPGILDASSQSYDTTIQIHPAEGPMKIVNSRQWLQDSLREWTSQGWVGSEVTKYHFDQLNPSTAAFKARWRSWYSEADEDFECSWYLVDAKDDSWVITRFAMIDCAEHGLESE